MITVTEGVRNKQWNNRDAIKTSDEDCKSIVLTIKKKLKSSFKMYSENMKLKQVT